MKLGRRSMTQKSHRLSTKKPRARAKHPGVAAVPVLLPPPVLIPPPEVARDYSANTPENRQRQRTIYYSVPHHPIVTWQNWVLELDALDRARESLLQAIERNVSPAKIEKFRSSLGQSISLRQHKVPA